LRLHVSISGSSTIYCASVSIVFLPQEEENARSQEKFKVEQAAFLNNTIVLP
jgi:hypothetical protein